VKNLKTGIMQNKHTHEDGTPFTKEEFLQKLKTDEEFNDEFGNKGIDQISELIRQLKNNPDSRRLLVSAWVVHDLPNMVLPPCHYGFQVYTRELSLNDRVLEFAKRNLDPSEFRRGGNYGTVIPEERTLEVLNNHNIPTRAISLMWNQRSVDTFLGLPFNIASYGLLLEMIADEVNMVPDELIGNLGDVHLYKNHIEQAKEQITREPMELPTVHVRDGIFCNSINDIILENYQSHPTIKAPLSN
jgi:thymidylate synthase